MYGEGDGEESQKYISNYGVHISLFIVIQLHFITLSKHYR